MTPVADGILAHMLALASALSLSAYVADIGPNETQVILAAIGAVTSLVNFVLLRRGGRSREQHQRAVRKAIGERGLVAMVPEQIVKDVQSNEPHNRRAGDEAP